MNMENYITSVASVFQRLNQQAEHQRDKRMKMISLVIFNYVRYLAKQHDVDLKTVLEKSSNVSNVPLLPIFEYIEANRIALYDFKTIRESDVNLQNKDDLERFVLTHVYYLTQQC